MHMTNIVWKRRKYKESGRYYYCGYVDAPGYGLPPSPDHKYYVGGHNVKLIADVFNATGQPLCLDIPIKTLKQGIALCEAWEATGAY